MPVAKVQLADGRIARFEVPEGTTPQQVEAFAMENAAAISEPSFMDRLGRTAGLGARAVVKGVSAIPTAMAEVAAVPLRAITGGKYFPSPSATLDANLSAAGLPEPANATERVTQDVVGGMAGGGATMAAGRVLANSASPVTAGVGGVLASQPLAQTIGAGTGGAAGGATRESGGGLMAQLIAQLMGGMAPSVLSSATPAAVKGVFRGGEAGRQTTADNIKLFEEAGYGSPTAGQATESRVARGIESALSKTPGSAGRMVAAGQQGAENLGNKITTLADDLAPGATSTKAGATIEKGVGRFVDRFKAEQNFLYDKLDSKIPASTPIKVDNTKTALAELNADIPGAPALSEWFKNAKIKGIEGALKSDMRQSSPMQLFAQEVDGALPYEAIKKLRTLVGRELENPSLVSDVPRSKWKALYAALSDDLGIAAKTAGPEAEKAFQRANTYTRAGHERIGTYLDRVAGKDTVEKVFQAAVAPSEIREGASTINAVIRSLEPAERKVVQAAFLKRLGTATAGNQDAAGEIFSPQTFLTNWNKISPEAKMTLFSGRDGGLRADLDQIAKVAGNIREGSKVFANPSGTGQALSSQMAGGGALISILTGHPGVAGAIGATAGAANMASRLMTNPEFVKWLATTTVQPTGAIPAALNNLSQVASRMGAQDKAAAHQFIEQARKATEARQ